MTVLITGGTGWIGSHVVRELVARDQQVVTFDSTREGWRVRDLPGVQLVKGDILDFPGLYEAIQKHQVTHLVHLAAILKGDSQRNPKRLFKVNCEGTINVLEAARIAGVRRLVFGSSLAVYGLTTREPVDEDHPTSPIDMYGATKVLGETFLREYHRLYGLDFAAMRFSHVYGPGRIKGTAVWKDLFEYPARGEKYVLPSGGDHRLNWSYVKDCATATASACLVEKLEYHFFNVCEGVQHTPREIADLIATEIVPGAQFEIGPGLVPGNPAEHCMDIQRAKSVLDWQPRFDMARGCRDYLKDLLRAPIDHESHGSVAV
ncbi:MAG: NAD(P)-dependent oxidoreductase [Chloroflexi bacterium]|nr:NAD(P)-dependent oxidoreductase [Chloroflexota bacterium]